MNQQPKHRHLALGIALSLFSMAASAEMVGIATSKETLAKTYGGKVYSPYAQRSFPTFPLWGETHLHTGYSMDAGLFGMFINPIPIVPALIITKDEIDEIVSKCDRVIGEIAEQI